jgi:hypothetical protein
LFPLVATQPEHDREKPKIRTPLVGEILIAGLSMCNFETNNVARAGNVARNVSRAGELGYKKL